MKRRAFIGLLGGAAASSFVLPTASNGQAAMPVIGFLHSASLEPNAKRLAGFKRGLGDRAATMIVSPRATRGAISRS